MNELSLSEKTEEIKQGLSDLASRISSGDESELLLWLIPNQLACAHRPLRYHQVFGGSRKDLPKAATEGVLEWAKRIEGYEIRSIICLMHPKEFLHYANLNLGSPDLLQFYQKQGFEVCHIPWEDPAHRPLSGNFNHQEELRRICPKALDAFDKLPKPVLLHCSAGQDRSAPVAAYIFTQKQTE